MRTSGRSRCKFPGGKIAGGKGFRDALKTTRKTVGSEIYKASGSFIGSGTEEKALDPSSTTDKENTEEDLENFAKDAGMVFTAPPSNQNKMTDNARIRAQSRTL